MKNNHKHSLLVLLLCGGMTSAYASQIPLGNPLPLQKTTLPDLQKYIQKVEMDMKTKQSLHGYRYDGSMKDYKARPGIVNKAVGNCDNGRGFYKPEWMFDNEVNNSDKYYFTERTGRVPANMRGQRHWVTFDFANPQDDIVIKFTCANMEQRNYGDAPTKIALVAPKAGETNAWTDTVYIGKSIPTYPTTYVEGQTKNNTTYVGRCKLSHAVTQLRFVCLERAADPSTSLEPNGPYWGLAEMRVYNSAEWEAVNPHFAQVKLSVREELYSSIAEAKKVVENGGDANVAFTKLETAYKTFNENFNYIAHAETNLSNLLSKVESDYNSTSTAAGHTYEGSVADYQKHKGLVNNGVGNCDNANGYYKPAWMFNCDVANTQNNYYTERGGRIPANMKGQRHWVMFDLPQALDDICIKFTCVINVDQVAYGEAPTKIAIVAPKEGETTDWTDTLYIGKSIPSYPTEYAKGVIKENSTYIGRIKFAHPAKQIRFVGLERLDNPATTLDKDGPFWGLAEMRIFDGKEWDPSPLFQKIPQEISTALVNAIKDAKKALVSDKEQIIPAYEALNAAYEKFLDAYIVAQSCIVNVKTSLPAGETFSFEVNHSEKGYMVDWGDGVLKKYSTDVNNPFNLISGQIKGKQITVSCINGWKMLRAENAHITSIDLTAGTDLQSLYLSGNELKSISLKGMNQLRDLDCSHNAIENIEYTDEKNFAADIPNIEQINLNNNRLNGLVDFHALSQLNYLNIANNKITNINVEETQLRTLLCSNNAINNILLLKGVNQLSNFVGNNNALTNIILANEGKNIYKFIADDNKLSLKLNLSNAARLKYLSCSNNNLRIVQIPMEHPIEGLQLSNNRLNFSSLPGEEFRPKNIEFEPQDTLDISNVKGMLKKDTVVYARLADSWANRDKTAIDLSSYCKMANTAIDVDIEWYSIHDDGTTQKLTACNQKADGDFSFEDGKVSFFSYHKKAYAVMTSNVYGFKLVTYPITLGSKDQTGINNVEKEDNLIIKTTNNGICLLSMSEVPAKVVSVDGKTVWRGKVNGQQFISLVKGCYLVNGCKIIF